MRTCRERTRLLDDEEMADAYRIAHPHRSRWGERGRRHDESAHLGIKAAARQSRRDNRRWRRRRIHRQRRPPRDPNAQ